MYRNLFFIYIIPLLIFIGCTNKVEHTIEPPEDLIARDTMVDILVDIRLFEASLVFDQKKGVKDFNERKYYLYNSIMNKYNISREQFESSFTYYQSDLEVMDKIYADAITKLSLVKSKLELED
ncbi:MAG: DUF4296 domain-containing protein [Bacteroidales bacterium]|nr:DUF4296 domain-containing protein [Bacteroidales bacterium]